MKTAGKIGQVEEKGMKKGTIGEKSIGLRKD